MAEKAGVAANVTTLAETRDAEPNIRTASFRPSRADSDVAAILYTSGTTGRSKGAMISHDNLASNAKTLVDIWGFTPDDVLVHALPIYHVHGLFVALHCALLSGATTRFLPRFEIGGVLARARRCDRIHGRADVLHAPARDAGISAPRHIAAPVDFRLRAAACPRRLRRSSNAPVLQFWNATE